MITGAFYLSDDADVIEECQKSISKVIEKFKSNFQK